MQNKDKRRQPGRPRKAPFEKSRPITIYGEIKDERTLERVWRTLQKRDSEASKSLAGRICYDVGDSVVNAPKVHLIMRHFRFDTYAEAAEAGIALLEKEYTRRKKLGKKPGER